MQDNISQFIDEHFSKIFSKNIQNDVIKYQKQYQFEMGENGSMWNNESDAFRHAYMQAFIACIDEQKAKELGDAHEHNGNKNHQDIAESRMDLHNNEQGRKIAQEIKNKLGKTRINPFDPKIKDIIAEEVVKKMQQGKLILSPDGKRQPKKELKLNNKKQNITAPTGCAGTYSVSGYTRTDGTKISGYSRTCGAKHEDIEKYKTKKFQDISQDELQKAISYFV